MNIKLQALMPDRRNLDER